MTLTLTPEQAEALFDCLCEFAMQMDDDGREGAFDASPLKPIYTALNRAIPLQPTKAKRGY
jgi:hypothetical protein